MDEESFNDMSEQIRWLVFYWRRPEAQGEEGSWKAYQSISKFPYWAIIHLISEGNIPVKGETLIMVHAMPPNVDTQIGKHDLVSAPHWFSLTEGGGNVFGVYPMEISEKEFLKRIEQQMAPKSEVKAAQEKDGN